MAINCDRFGFFNGIYGLEQANWANYWRGIIPDGIIAGIKNEVEVVPSNTYVSGVSIKTGEAMVDNHRVWINAQKELQLPAASTDNNRIDLVVLRAVYGNSGASKVEIDCITSSVAASPVRPTMTKVTGNKYEIPLAAIYRPRSDNAITTDRISDLRYVFCLPGDESLVAPFSGTSVTVKNDREHRNNTAIANLTINLPANPLPTFITGVCFKTGASFSGVTFRKGSSAHNPKVTGDTLTMLNKKYNLVIWWDGEFYNVASKAVIL